MTARDIIIIAAAIAAIALVGCSRDVEPASTTPSGGSEPTAEHQGAAHGDNAPHAQAAQPEGQAPSSFDSPPPVGTRAHCPVMGNDFVVTESSLRSEYNGRHYVFCCPACKPRFDANPSEFIGG